MGNEELLTSYEDDYVGSGYEITKDDDSPRSSIEESVNEMVIEYKFDLQGTISYIWDNIQVPREYKLK